MDTLECIRTRRSMRKYKEDPVPEEKLQKLLEAIQWAPSWANVQPWEVVIVDDPKIKESLQAALPDGNPGRKALLQAPLVLAMIGKKGVSGVYNNVAVTELGDWVMFDMGIACQTLCLAATALGLGSLNVGMFNQSKANQVLGVPEGYTVFELIPIGTPAKEAVAPARKKIEDFVHKNKFGNR